VSFATALHVGQCLQGHIHGGYGVDSHGAVDFRHVYPVEGLVARDDAGAVDDDVYLAAGLYGGGIGCLHIVVVRHVDAHALHLALGRELGYGGIDACLVDVPDDEHACTLLQGHASHNLAYARRSAGDKHTVVLNFHS